MSPSPADTPAQPPAGPTRSVERALDLLAAVVEDAPAGRSLSDLARAAGLAPATASRLLATLAGRGLVRRGEQGEYRPGPRLMQLAAAVLRGDPLYELAGPHLAALAHGSGETANLGIAIDGERALYLRQAAGAQRVQTATWTGRTIPRDSTAMGAALASSVGAGGYAVSRGSLEPDVVAVAVPVHGHDGVIVAALSILAPSYRTGERELERHASLLVEHARALSGELGGR